ncbi:PspC domain-containing protein [Curtobacterium sp. MCPF17_002]|uniref:PspC domain-containing protein n=1 Tax=Curtobacterium sp. MCPF17_002 TaxID=2175645 RepID=UPI0015E88208|nr:PspC domain-containing protein [Curtobacterium sp. MCPF17_002]WIB78486.1 PspC domain-containing protein [Curtobacterium sp. MCPF17_002]
MTRQDTGGPASATRFFDWIRGIHVTRTDDRWVAGVCGAVAARTGLDPLVVRGIVIVVALLGGPVFLAYAAGWALLPDSSGRIHLERMIRGVLDPALIAIGVLVVLTFVPAVQGIWWQGVPVAWGMPGWLSATLGTAWTIALVGCAVWLVVVLARRGPQRTAPGSPGGTPAGAPGETTGAAASAAAPDGTRRDFWTSPEDPPADRATWATNAATGAPDPATAGPTASATDAGRASWQWDTTTARTAADRHRDHLERMRAERERAAERRARRAERLPGAAFVAVSLGLALVAGAAVAVWAQQADLSVPVLGIAAAVVVLAVATIVAGIRGRESGGLGLFSTIGVVALVVTGVLPGGTQLSVIGGTTWRVDDVGRGAERNYAMVVGGPTLDLRGLGESDGGGRVNLWLGAGGATVLLPTDAPVRVQVSGVGYGVDTDAGDSGDSGDDAQGGVLGTTTVENRAARTATAADTTTVHVWVLGGGVDVPRGLTVNE